MHEYEVTIHTNDGRTEPRKIRASSYEIQGDFITFWATDHPNRRLVHTLRSAAVWEIKLLESGEPS